MPAIAILILAALAAGALVASGAGAKLGEKAAERTIRRRLGKEDPNLTLTYARKWGPVFGAPTAYLMTLAHGESRHNPRMHDPTAANKGGAWGLVAQMADEADGKVKGILKGWGNRPDVQTTARKWTGQPEDLWDPDLNLMISAWQVGKLVKKFGRNFPVVAAGYHQGETAVERRLASGRPAVDPSLQPKGAVYVARAEKLYPLYQGIS